MASNKKIREVNKIITKLIDKNISIKEFRDKIESIFIKHLLTKVDFNIDKLYKKIKMERTAKYRKLFLLLILYNLKIKKPKKIKK
jgi:hypothetical protein